MTVTTSCYHCGLPVADESAYRALVDGESHPVCCPGCQAVAEAIGANGLSSYYRTRTAFAPRGADRPADQATALAIYDRPEVQAAFVQRIGENERETTLILEGITCAACVWLNEQHLSRLPWGTAAVRCIADRAASGTPSEELSRVARSIVPIPAVSSSGPS